MDTINSLEADLRNSFVAGYLPDKAILRQLAGVTLVCIVAPTSSGKSTLIDDVVATDPDFTRAISFTTREPRAGEDLSQYHFIKHTVTSLTEIKSKVDSGELVQFAIHPTTKRIYGSEIEAYQSPYVMLDILPEAVERMRLLPFKAVVIVGIASQPSVWLERFNQRDSNSNHEQRIAEGISNLNWSLGQGDDVYWLDNSRAPIHDLSLKLIKYVKDSNKQLDYSGSQSARRIAETLRDYLANLD